MKIFIQDLSILNQFLPLPIIDHAIDELTEKFKLKILNCDENTFITYLKLKPEITETITKYSKSSNIAESRIQDIESVISIKYHTIIWSNLESANIQKILEKISYQQQLWSLGFEKDQNYIKVLLEKLNFIIKYEKPEIIERMNRKMVFSITDTLENLRPFNFSFNITSLINNLKNTIFLPFFNLNPRDSILKIHS